MISDNLGTSITFRKMANHIFFRPENNGDQVIAASLIIFMASDLAFGKKNTKRKFILFRLFEKPQNTYRCKETLLELVCYSTSRIDYLINKKYLDTVKDLKAENNDKTKALLAEATFNQIVWGKAVIKRIETDFDRAFSHYYGVKPQPELFRSRLQRYHDLSKKESLENLHFEVLQNLERSIMRGMLKINDPSESIVVNDFLAAMAVKVQLMAWEVGYLQGFAYESIVSLLSELEKKLKKN